MKRLVYWPLYGLVLVGILGNFGCGDCSTNSDCPQSKVCVDGECTSACGTGRSCRSGRYCNSYGECVVPQCRNDADCGHGNVCADRECVNELILCTCAVTSKGPGYAPAIFGALGALVLAHRALSRWTSY